MSQAELGESRYHKGTIPIPDTCWLVETTTKKGLKFRKVGIVKVSGKLVAEEMNAHMSIKGYEPMDIAEKVAHKKFPRTNPIILTEINCK